MKLYSIYRPFFRHGHFQSSSAFNLNLITGHLAFAYDGLQNHRREFVVKRGISFILRYSHQ